MISRPFSPGSPGAGRDGSGNGARASEAGRWYGRRLKLGAGVALLGLGFSIVLTSCDYSDPDAARVTASPGTYERGSGLGPSGIGGPSTDAGIIPAGDKGAILDSVIKLIQTAALKPGGDNFAIATKNLNQYFSDAGASDYELTPEARAYLLEVMPAGAVKELENPSFRMPDARHLEDCMLYYGIANRVGGAGDDLTRVRRVFRWIIDQIQLVPAGSLGAPGLGQAQARPYDVLVRGMATESEGFWAERGWLFMVLCRQLGIDVGLLTYTPKDGPAPIVWTCTALIEGKLYLFDTRIGLEVPGPDASPSTVATLDDALNDPSVLDRLDLPGQSPYGTTRAALLGSSSKIGVLLDSSPDYRSPRMALLQKNLAGRNRTILYRDPAEERNGFARALGDRVGKIGFWELPAQVETLLFTSAQFVQATQFALALFDPNRYPLVYARIKQLRGDIDDAINDYVDMRFAYNPTLVDKRTPMPQEIQQAHDIYATYFLGMCHLEEGRPERARFFFEETLRLLPAPGRGQPYYNMFRWGAAANLGRICEAKGEVPLAIAYYTQVDPTPQRHGNLIRARALLWPDPIGTLPPDLPDAPVPMAPPALIAAPPG